MTVALEKFIDITPLYDSFYNYAYFIQDMKKAKKFPLIFTRYLNAIAAFTSLFPAII